MSAEAGTLDAEQQERFKWAANERADKAEEALRQLLAVVEAAAQHYEWSGEVPPFVTPGRLRQALDAAYAALRTVPA